jgi:hypothetical protein
MYDEFNAVENLKFTSEIRGMKYDSTALMNSCSCLISTAGEMILLKHILQE